MPRHSLRRSLGAPLCASILLACFGALPAAAQSSPPNIVFILLDDLGVGELQWYPELADLSGASADPADAIQTPELFALAQQGVRFTNYYSAAPVCSPTRAAILTGRYAQEFGLRRVIPPTSGRGLPQVVTLPLLLNAGAGYATGHFGKWHLGEMHPDYYPTNRGFGESWVWYNTPGSTPTYQGASFVENADLAGVSVIAPGEHIAQTVTDKALAFVEAAEASGTPYFLNLWYRSPHGPTDPPADFPGAPTTTAPASSWGVDWSTLVSGIPELAPYAYYQNHDANSSAKRRAMYAAMVTWVDHQIGRVVAKVDELDPSGNTLILVASDNGGIAKGYAQDAAGMATPAPPLWQPNGSLRGSKASVYEGGIQSPLIARWPAEISSGGGRNDSFASSLDFFPTLLEVAEVPPVQSISDFPGESLYATLLGLGPEPPRAQPIFWETKEQTTWPGVVANQPVPGDELNRYAARDEGLRRKLVVERGGSWGLPLAVRLFDVDLLLGSGVAEDDIKTPSLNLAGSEPASVAALEAAYRAWRLDVGRIPHAYDAAASSAELIGEKLHFDAPGQVVLVKPDSRFQIRDADLSFQTRLRLDATPTGASEVTVAEHAGSWRLWLSAGPSGSQVTVNLSVTGKLTPDFTDPGLPGDTALLGHVAACAAGCDLDLAFTIFGWRHSESSIQLYVEGSPVDSFTPAADGTEIAEVWANLSDPIRLGNDASGSTGLVGLLHHVRFYHASLTAQEVADGDRDGTPNSADTCPHDPSPSLDSNGDGVGDLCSRRCDDGLDNDLDGATDHPADPGCASRADDLEDPECADGIDNDGDGSIDHPDDPQCLSPAGDREAGPACGLGPELAPLLVVLAWRGRRRRLAEPKP